MSQSELPLLKTALHALHAECGARFVPFAGYEMPVQYPLGVLKEHLHTRNAAGLFDVSHMGQLQLTGPTADAALEKLVPVDVIGLTPGQQRYAIFTNEQGGILDDLMITRMPDGNLFVVVNAACKEQDTAYLREQLGGPGKPGCDIIELSDYALLALQGPTAVSVLARLTPEIDFQSWTFMTARTLELCGVECFVTRSGYTGEDGFEISIPNEQAEALARRLLQESEVEVIGLGARDSLRLEAGLCLYGHDLTIETTPIEASLTWAISKARRADGARAGDFPGAEKILGQMAQGVTTKRVGLIGLERTPVREGAELVDDQGVAIGRVTSGGFGPSFNGTVAMGYLDSAHVAVDTPVFAMVRGKPVAMRVAKTPFVPQRYYRGK